ncbi:MAG: DUF1553 domain-containing protein [Bryobacterales bacterium]
MKRRRSPSTSPSIRDAPRPDPDCDTQERLRGITATASRAKLRRAHHEAHDLEAALAKLDRDVETTMVMREMDDPRETYILGRGDYRNHTEKVTPGVPSALPPLPVGAKANRLALARWLVSPEHPLTARVAVNRYWEMYFGQGLVKTTEDFGSQGEAPTHPELLDWLAVEFMDSGWDIRHMQKLIVTSATYRQSSGVTPQGAEARPGEPPAVPWPPVPLVEAEMVRRQCALCQSGGLLEEKVGGTQREPLSAENRNLGGRQLRRPLHGAERKQDHGDALYRRSMYTFWKRTAPPPSLTNFDAPDREKCTVRRARTNTPLQALTLLNDPTYVEASRALATRVMREAGASDADRLARAYELTLGRAPTAGERDVLLTLLSKQREDYRSDGQAARELLSVGESPVDPDLDQAELAAWTVAASTVLNLDEAVTKE